MALSGLVPALPLLFKQFALEPHRELLVPMIITWIVWAACTVAGVTLLARSSWLAGAVLVAVAVVHAAVAGGVVEVLVGQAVVAVLDLLARRVVPREQVARHVARRDADAAAQLAAAYVDREKYPEARKLIDAGLKPHWSELEPALRHLLGRC